MIQIVQIAEDDDFLVLVGDPAVVIRYAGK